MTKNNVDLKVRMRDKRKNEEVRAKNRETILSPKDLVYPLFVTEGNNQKVAIDSMPDSYRLSIDNLVKEVEEAYSLGIPSVALFPNIDEKLKDKYATESKNPDGLLQRAIMAIKIEIPQVKVITDVAMDPYSSDGHDGLVENGEILNDETLPILADMALAQARAGADMVAPSDMMDGRIAYIRKRLDENGFKDVGIISYAAKYCSAFYGPFRDALNSAPKSGDKKTYQMDPANAKEAIEEVRLDIEEGADVVMIKPALPYLDVIRLICQKFDVSVAAYNVSGEYAMIKAAAQKGWLDEEATMLESLLSIKRAGASMIFTYFAKQAALALKKA